jgi:hypothetical protein
MIRLVLNRLACIDHKFSENLDIKGCLIDSGSGPAFAGHFRTLKVFQQSVSIPVV